MESESVDESLRARGSGQRTGRCPLQASCFLLLKFPFAFLPYTDVV